MSGLGRVVGGFDDFFDEGSFWMGAELDSGAVRFGVALGRREWRELFGAVGAVHEGVFGVGGREGEGVACGEGEGVACGEGDGSFGEGGANVSVSVKKSRAEVRAETVALAERVERAQARLGEQVRETWAYHPGWTLGRLLSSAASISRGELRVNPLYVSDEEIMSGLRALIPDPAEFLPQPRD